MIIDELARAMRGVARRKLAAGIEPRDPISKGMRFEDRQPFPRVLITIAVLSALVLVAVVVSKLAEIPPAHIFIVAFSIALGWLWLGAKRRK